MVPLSCLPPPRVRTSGPSGPCLGRAPWTREGCCCAVPRPGSAQSCQVTSHRNTSAQNQSLGQALPRSFLCSLEQSMAGAFGISHWSLSRAPAVLSFWQLVLSVPLGVFASLCPWCCKPAGPVLCGFAFPFPPSLSCLLHQGVSSSSEQTPPLPWCGYAWGHGSSLTFPGLSLLRILGTPALLTCGTQMFLFCPCPFLWQ